MPLNSLGEHLYERSGEWNSLSISLSTTPSYDAVGNLSSLTYHGGARTEYSHDKRGAITGTAYSRDGVMAATQIGSATYDIAGRMTSMQMGQIDQFTDTGRAMFGQQTYRYDADGDLKEINYKWAANTPSGQWGPAQRFDQNAAGQITKAYFTNGYWRYTPDEDKVEDYGVANALDQYQSVDMDDGQGVRDFAYDGNGNMTSDGASWFPVAEMLGSDNPADTYGIPDG